MWVHQEKTRLNIAVNSNKDLFQAWLNVQIPYPFLASGILPAGLIQPEDFRAKHLTGTGHPLISFNFNILKNQEGLTRGCNLQLGHHTFAQQRGKKQPRKLRGHCVIIASCLFRQRDYTQSYKISSVKANWAIHFTRCNQMFCVSEPG